MADVVLQFLYRVADLNSYTAPFKCPQRENFSLGTLEKCGIRIQIRTRYSNWRTASATQLQPSESLCYIWHTSTWSDVRSCVLMQEATTSNILYDGISFQHLATVLISVFTLCYGPGLLFRGTFCNRQLLYISIDMEKVTYFRHMRSQRIWDE
jgi:hypothetical protein